MALQPPRVPCSPRMNDFAAASGTLFAPNEWLCSRLGYLVRPE